MTRHYAYGLDLTDLDVVIVDDSKPMQAILRSTLLGFRVRRVRTYDTADEAMEVMRIDPPNLVITDWRMRPTSGIALLRNLRQRKTAPLCFLPVIFVTAHGTRTVIDRILRDGAQNVVIKPVSPSALHDRLVWTLRDDRPLVLGEHGRYVIDGVAEMLDLKAQKWQRLGVHRAGLAERTVKTRLGTVGRETPAPDIILPDTALAPAEPAANTRDPAGKHELVPPISEAEVLTDNRKARGRAGDFAKVKRVRRARGFA